MYIDRGEWAQWGPQLENWLDKRFSRDVLSRFNSLVEPNWLAWLDAQQSDLDGNRQDSVELFGQELRKRYLGVTVFHATRLVDLDGVRQIGLRAWSADDLRKQAHSIFAKATEADKLRDAIEQSNPEHRGGRVYSFASLNHALGRQDESMPGKLPSFAVLGGEFLTSVGLRDGVSVSRELQEHRRGYILACNLPWERLDTNNFSFLAKDILQTVIILRFFDTTAFNMLGDRECISTMFDIPREDIKFFADVEDLKERNDLAISDITWQPFAE